MLWRRRQLYPLIVQSASGCDLALYKQEVDGLKNVSIRYQERQLILDHFFFFYPIIPPPFIMFSCTETWN